MRSLMLGDKSDFYQDTTLYAHAQSGLHTCGGGIGAYIRFFAVQSRFGGEIALDLICERAVDAD